MHNNHVNNKGSKEQSSSTEDDTDEFQARIDETGCSKENELVQECYFKHHDWRKCQDELKLFQACFQRINNEQSKK